MPQSKLRSEDITTMRNRITKIVAAIGLIVTVGVTMASMEASAGTRTCYRCTGGWCCY